MKFVNEFDLIDAQRRFVRASKPNRLAAALVVAHLADWANDNSDGWAYWPKPVRAASRAIDLFAGGTWTERQAQESVDATDDELRAAIKPIKAFLTRQGVSGEQREIILRAAEDVLR